MSTKIEDGGPAASVPSALDRIMADDGLRRARTKLSFDEIKKMIDHTKAAVRESASRPTWVSDAMVEEAAKWMARDHAMSQSRSMDQIEDHVAKHWRRYSREAGDILTAAFLAPLPPKETDWEALFDECATARDAFGFIGTVPECIAYYDALTVDLRADVTRLTKGLADLLGAAKAARQHIFGDLGNGHPILAQLDAAISSASEPRP